MRLFSGALGTSRGLAWGVSDTWGTSVAKGLIQWYWHWQDGPVKQFASLEFVPCFWGPTKSSQWAQRKVEMASNLLKAILGFNEPDIDSQSNLTPAAAVALYKKEVWPYKAKGVGMGSPQIVWNVDWLASFLTELNKLGCDVDFIALHWYGGYTKLADLKSYVQTVRNKFGKPIWITEYGVTGSMH